MKQTRVNACGASFYQQHHSGAIAVLSDLRGVVIRCHPSQVPAVIFAMSEHPFKLPVVGDLSIHPSHVKYTDVATGGVEYMVDGLQPSGTRPSIIIPQPCGESKA